MENKQLQNSNKGNQSLGIAPEINEVGKALIHFNQLTPYPYSDLQLIDWAKSIIELMPQIKTSTIKTIIDRMKMGIYEYNDRQGIQNIFSGARQFIKDEISLIEIELDPLLERDRGFGGADYTDEEKLKIKDLKEKIGKLRNNLSKLGKSPELKNKERADYFLDGL